MNCREFLIEFEERGTLTEPATLHLTVCTDCKKTSERQAQIWLTIDNFARVSAPNDFDFRVKARIANANAADFQPRFLPVLRYVLPVAVVAVLVGLIVFNTSYFSRGNTNNVATAEQPKAVEGTTTAFDYPAESKSFAPPAQNEQAETIIPKEIAPPSVNRVPRDEIAEASLKQRRKNSKNDDVGGGSRDSGVGSKKSLAPKGINLDSNSRVEGSKSPEAAMLEFNGIKIAVENGKRTVKSVEPNNTAARSGVKVGDVIEKVEGDSIFVLRGAERIEIKLQTTINQP